MRRSTMAALVACLLPASGFAAPVVSGTMASTPAPVDDPGTLIDQLATRIGRLPADHRAEIVRALRSLGPGAADAVLQRLQAESPAMLLLQQHSRAAHEAFVAALLDALGSWRVSKAEATFTRYFETPESSLLVAKMAAEGLGRLCSESSTSTLAAHLRDADPRETTAADGLGLCRTEASARALIGRLQARPAPETTRALASALGMLGSSWAWEALGPTAQPLGQRVRSMAASALLDAYPRSEGSARHAIITALLMIDDRATTESALSALAANDELRIRWTHLHSK